MAIKKETKKTQRKAVASGKGMANKSSARTRMNSSAKSKSSDVDEYLSDKASKKKINSFKKKKPLTADEREKYTKSYRKSRKTKAGSSKALHGGSVSHKAAIKSAKKKAKKK
ncbi:MAG: hypothetical protein KAS93_07965 [Gammaproteobacteria bacterium]|nr:hypothetical protein [Gammaproteobacteria bacterium]